MSIEFKVVVPTYNAAPWIEACLRSIQTQSYSNFECLVIDDASTDKTFEVLSKLKLDERFTILRNPVNLGPLANTYHGFERLGCRKTETGVSNPSESTSGPILTIVDGDDRLAHDNAFATVANYYEADPTLLMTYGNYACDVAPNTGMCSRYSESAIQRRDFRKENACVSCLRTFKAKLWNGLKKKDLINPDTGRFFAAGGDVAYLLPLLDMAGDRFRFIEEIIYLYNTNNPVSDSKIRAQEQMHVDWYVRNLPKYDLLP